MFIFKEGERVYLTAWEYNTARMLGKLAEIVEQKGQAVYQGYGKLLQHQE